MELFLFSILPISLIAFFYLKKEGKFIPVIFIGLISAILVCGCNAFFLTAHRIIPDSFYQNFIYFLHKRTLFPVIILYGIFLIFIKDDWDFKIKCFFPLETAFFMIYMPFTLLKGHTVNFSFFELFTYPFITFVMIFTVSILISRFFSLINRKKILLAILCFFLILVYLVIPSLLQTLFVMNTENLVRYILSVLYIILPVGLRSFRFILSIKKNSEKEE